MKKCSGTCISPRVLVLRRSLSHRYQKTYFAYGHDKSVFYTGRPCLITNAALQRDQRTSFCDIIINH